MINFDFQVKTKLFFGKDKHLQIGKVLNEFNAKKVLVFVGQGSVKRVDY